MSNNADNIEIWEEVKGYDGWYEVSNLGRVRSGRVLNPYTNPKGYKVVHLTDSEGVGKTRRVHRLVAQAFIPNPQNKSDVNHLNGIKTDNRAVNLEWCNRRENVTHYEKTRTTSSQYTGVTYCPRCTNRPWEVRTTLNGVRKYIGKFPTEIEARDAYLNFIAENSIENKYAKTACTG